MILASPDNLLGFVILGDDDGRPVRASDIIQTRRMTSGKVGLLSYNRPYRIELDLTPRTRNRRRSNAKPQKKLTFEDDLPEDLLNECTG